MSEEKQNESIVTDDIKDEIDKMNTMIANEENNVDITRKSSPNLPDKSQTQDVTIQEDDQPSFDHTNKPTDTQATIQFNIETNHNQTTATNQTAQDSAPRKNRDGALLPDVQDPNLVTPNSDRNTLDNLREGASIQDTFRTNETVTAERVEEQQRNEAIKDSTFDHDQREVQVQRQTQSRNSHTNSVASNSIKRNQHFNEENHKDQLNVNNQLKKLRLFKKAFGESLSSRTSNSSAMTQTTASTRRDRIKSLALPKGKFKTDPQNADPLRIDKRKEKDQKYQLSVDRWDQIDLAEHFIKSIDQKRKFMYEQRFPNHLNMVDKKSGLTNELHPYGLSCPKITQTTVQDKNVLNNIQRDNIKLQTRRNNDVEKQNIEIDTPESFQKQYQAELTHKKERDIKLTNFEMKTLNNSMKMERSRTMSSLSRSLRKDTLKDIETTGNIHMFTKSDELSNMQDKFRELKQRKGQIEKGNYDKGYFLTFDEPSTITKLKFLDNKQFPKYMEKENRELAKVVKDSRKTMGRHFKVSTDLKNSYRSKLTTGVFLDGPEDQFKFLKKSNDEVLGTYDRKKRPKSEDSRFGRKAAFELGSDQGQVEKWVKNTGEMTPREYKQNWLKNSLDGKMETVNRSAIKVNLNENKYLEHSGTVTRHLNNCFNTDHGTTKKGFSNQYIFNKSQSNVLHKNSNTSKRDNEANY